jgi:hypothetical protein
MSLALDAEGAPWARHLRSPEQRLQSVDARSTPVSVFGPDDLDRAELGACDQGAGEHEAGGGDRRGPSRDERGEGGQRKHHRRGDPKGGIVQVLEDATVDASPDVGAKAAAALSWKHGAGFIGADVGGSGDMVDSTMRLVDPRVKVLEKGGNKGKRAWAESVAVLYSKHLVSHSPVPGKLEDECCRRTDDVKLWSPDRMDGLAYVANELAFEAPPSLAGLNREQVAPR